MLDKIDKVDRRAIESIREARTVRIIINEGTDDECEFNFAENRGNMSDFRRNLRLSVQDYVKDCMDFQRRQMWKTWMGERLQ